MSEMTNQSDELELDLGLGNEEETEPEETEPAEQEEVSEETADTFELGIRYNGQDMTLDREKATMLAQKGMNYDKVYQQLQDLKNDPVRKLFEQQAADAGLTVQEYAQRMQEFRDQASTQKIAREFKNQNPDITDEVALEYAKQAYANQKSQTEAQTRARQAQAQQEANDALIREVQEFNELYPDVDIKDLPPEVIDDINTGTKLETAYLRYMSREYRKRISNTETNMRNKQKNIGSAADNVGGSGGDDPFLKGLLG